MKVLVLGAQGMLGSELVRSLSATHIVHAARRDFSAIHSSKPIGLHTVTDVTDEEALETLLLAVRPEFVINAVGVVKQLIDNVAKADVIATNAMLPHQIAHFAQRLNFHLLHISTDCVFSGDRGEYRETDAPDPRDTYGMTKFLGEPSSDRVTVLRCSMIGLEMHRPHRPTHGLIEWLLRQRGTASGFSRSIFSGLTTAELSRVIELVCRKGGLAGTWHVASEPISKFDLLRRLTDRIPELKIDVVEEPGPAIDRSLDASHFRQVANYAAPRWDMMLDELATAVRSRLRERP